MVVIFQFLIALQDHFFTFNGKIAGSHRVDGLVEGSLKLVFGASDSEGANYREELRPVVQKYVNGVIPVKEGKFETVRVVTDYIFRAHFSGISGLPSSIRGSIRRERKQQIYPGIREWLVFAFEP